MVGKKHDAATKGVWAKRDADKAHAKENTDETRRNAEQASLNADLVIKEWLEDPKS